MREWLDETFGPDALEAGILIGFMVLLVLGFCGYVVYLWRTGGDVKMALTSFALAFAFVYIMGLRR